MNCQQVEERLALYAGRDLEEKRTRLVSEHLQTCPACARVADEYRETVGLAQQFAPPVFSDIAYARVREQVLQRIENEPAAPLLPPVFGNWFRPRTAWAAASVVFIALGLFALYLVAKRPGDVQSVVKNHPVVTEQPGSTATTQTNPSSLGTTQKPQEDKRRRTSVKRSPLSAQKTRNTSSPAALISSKLRGPEATNSLTVVDAAPDKSPLRVELQTKDPNIRIIWFSQPVNKPALPNSKRT